MSRGFNANVPARKPRTRIGQVLTELTSEADEDGQATEREDRPPEDAIGDVGLDEAAEVQALAGTEAAVETSEALPRSATGVAEPERPSGVEASAHAGAAEVAAPPVPAPRVTSSGPRREFEGSSTREVSASPASKPRAAARHADVDAVPGPLEPRAEQVTAARSGSGRDRIAALRERLEVASRPRHAATEPRKTAATVRELVDALRARLDTAIRERSELATALEETKGALARARADLARERKARAAMEAVAAERERIADEAVAEAEAMAAERDQVLAELAEQRRLDDEQAALVAEAEAALSRREMEAASTARELARAMELLDARAVEFADLESRLEAEGAERARVEARCRELEAEVTRLGEAGAALEDIEEMVTRRA